MACLSSDAVSPSPPKSDGAEFKADRPQLGKLMKKLALGDVVITPAVDRLSRDTSDLLVIIREMQRAGAGIGSLARPHLDTTLDFTR